MRYALLFSLVLASSVLADPAPRAVVLDNDASCDIGMYPAATLLLPFFEVDFNSPQTSAINTIFTITNTSPKPQIVRITLWTDLGFPGLSFPLFLTGYDTQPISLYEVFARGNTPGTSQAGIVGDHSASNYANPNFADDPLCVHSGGTMSATIRERIQKLFTVGQTEDLSCRVGSRHTNAIGYATVDVVNTCAPAFPTSSDYYTGMLLYDNVLTGDYQRINPSPVTGNYAGGNPLVHIRAIPEGGKAGSTVAASPFPFTFYDRYTPSAARGMDRRQPLPSVFVARFIQGGTSGFKTNFIIWREGAVGPDRSACLYGANETLPLSEPEILKFDEHENVVGGLPCTTPLCSSASLPATSLTPVTASVFPPMPATADQAGWMWISLDNHLGTGPNGPYSGRRPSQNWMTIQMYAEGRYAVDFDATQLLNGCTVNPPSGP